MAELTYIEVLEYLEKNWTIAEMESFANRTEELVNHIALNPALYPFSDKVDSHRAVVEAD